MKLLLAVLLSMTTMASGQDPDEAKSPFSFPDTAAGHGAEVFLDAHNVGTEAAFREFDDKRSAESREQLPFDKLLPQLLSLRTQLGEMVPHSVVQSESQQISVLVEYGGGGSWGNLEISCETEPPHLIRSFTIVPAAPPEVSSKVYDAAQGFANLLEFARSDGGFPAIAVAVADKEGILHAAAVGVRAEGEEDKVKVTDRFHIGSITKALTATMIASLVQEQKLGWDTSIAELFPELTESNPYLGVELGQVLRHLAGIPSHTSFDAAGMKDLHALPGVPSEQRDAWIREVLQESPIAKPGTSMNYSNAGYCVATVMAERASKQSFEDLMQTALFRPFNLESAGFGWPREENENEPSGHYGKIPHKDGRDYFLGPCLAPAGDAHMSIRDLAQFGRMHLRGLQGQEGIIQAKTVKELHRPPSSGGYACGWVIKKDSGKPEVHWHNGTTGTFYALLAIYPEEDLVVAVAMNTANGYSEPIAWKIIEAILAHERE